jgi:hypothetical protein
MNSIKKCLLLVCSVVLFNSCDKVSPPFEEVNPVPPPPTEKVRKKVLVEDYTGHKCGNCPRASREIYNQKPVYGERLIIMAIHAGFFANTNVAPYTYNFKTPEGTQLDTDFGISLAGNPNGMVNRKLVDGSYIVGATKWVTEVGKVMNDTNEAALKISIDNNYDDASRVLQTEITSEFLTDLTGTYKMCVFIVEDSIVKWQKDYDVSPDDVEFYVHREVLRGTMNSTYGDAVTPTTDGTINTLNYTYSLPLDWDDSHISIIAYLYDEATKEILQVEQAEIDN